LHITNALGTTSASIIYICAAFFSLFCAPSIFAKVGPKWSLIIGEIGFLCFSIGNFYPSKFVSRSIAMQELRQIVIIAAEFGSQKNVFKGLSGLYIVSPYTGKSQRFGLYFLHSFATFFGFSTICCCRHLILKTVSLVL